MEEAAGDRPMIMINAQAGRHPERRERDEHPGSRRAARVRRRVATEPTTSGSCTTTPYFFPIFGALRYGEGTKWELYKRFRKMATEEYKLMRVYEDGEPSSARSRTSSSTGKRRERGGRLPLLLRLIINERTSDSFPCFYGESMDKTNFDPYATRDAVSSSRRGGD